MSAGAGLFFFSSRRRHTRYWRDWSSDVCSSDLLRRGEVGQDRVERRLDAEEEGGGREDEDVEDEDHVADAQERAALADEERRDLGAVEHGAAADGEAEDRKSTRLNSSHANISYAVFCLK